MDNIKKIINDCCKIINTKPLKIDELVNTTLTNHHSETIYLFKMNYINSKTVEFTFNENTELETKYTNNAYIPVNPVDNQFVMKKDVVLNNYVKNYKYYSEYDTKKYYEYMYDKYNKEHYDYYTSIGEKLCLNSVAKFTQYCAENNLNIKITNNCTKYSDFPNASIKFP
jgi:hypothetical protein